LLSSTEIEKSMFAVYGLNFLPSLAEI